jgi:molybdate transport system ATP-binding protein
MAVCTANNILHNGPKSTIHSQKSSPTDILSQIKSRQIKPSQSPILADLKDININHSGKPLLRNVNWTIHQGDHWLLLGPNGSGKTTLLSLLTGDNPKSFSQEITLFGRRRGSGKTT